MYAGQVALTVAMSKWAQVSPSLSSMPIYGPPQPTVLSLVWLGRQIVRLDPTCTLWPLAVQTFKSSTL